MLTKKEIEIGKQKQKAYYEALDKYNKALQKLLKAQREFDKASKEAYEACIEFDNAFDEAYEACDDPYITYDEYRMIYEDALND